MSVQKNPVWAKTIRAFNLSTLCKPGFWYLNAVADAAGRTLKSRSSPLPMHPKMKYFCKGKASCWHWMHPCSLLLRSYPRWSQSTSIILHAFGTGMFWLPTQKDNYIDRRPYPCWRMVPALVHGTLQAFYDKTIIPCIPSCSRLAGQDMGWNQTLLHVQCQHDLLSVVSTTANICWSSIYFIRGDLEGST